MSYFDQRALLAQGLPLHVVEMLRDVYNRAGGASVTVVNLSELETMVFELQGQMSKVSQLKAQLEAVNGLVAALPDHTAALSTIKRDIEQLKVQVEERPVDPALKDLTRRIEDLEAL